jgi:hypothetical protein
MTTPEITLELTPGQRRMAAAHAVRRRTAEAKWADVLRGRGWAIIDPDHTAALGRLVAEYAAANRCPVGDIWGALGMDTPDARD